MMQMRGLFITGTDTGVGKSIIAAHLTRALRAMGHDAVAIKPIETGCEGEPSDGALLMRAADNVEPIDSVVPFSFRQPLAPMVAASLEGRAIEPLDLVRSVRAIASRHAIVIVEGAGGLLVPIAKGYTMRDLARDLGMPIVIVAPLRLGALNHTLMSIECARAAGLTVAAVVLNEGAAPSGSIAEQTNPDALRALTDIPILGPFPRLPQQPYMDSITQAGDGSLDLAPILFSLGLSRN